MSSLKNRTLEAQNQALNQVFGHIDLQAICGEKALSLPKLSSQFRPVKDAGQLAQTALYSTCISKVV